jgi:recombinational DNA repair protein RecR
MLAPRFGPNKKRQNVGKKSYASSLCYNMFPKNNSRLLNLLKALLNLRKRIASCPIIKF